MKFLRSILLALLIILMLPGVIALREPTITGVPDFSFAKNADAEDLDRIVDLRNYTDDDFSNPSDLHYKIKSQSNIHLIDCFMDNDFYVSCNAPEYNAIGMSRLIVETTNSNGLSDTDEFNINIVQVSEPEEINFSVDRDKVVIEPGDSINVQLEVENTTQERTCFEVYTELDNDARDEIKATPGVREFCLNSGETTRFSLTITSFEDARTGFYDIEVFLDYSFGERSQLVIAEVADQEDPIDIVRTSDYFVCKEPYTQEIDVRLENNSSRTQRIELRASHELLLPVFEFPITTLRGNESDEMTMRIHTNETTALTDYTIPIFARSESYFVERDINIRLIDCNPDDFDLIVTPQEQRIERGGKEFFRVQLISNSDEGQDIRLSSDSDLPNELETYNVYLPANGVKEFDLQVRARETDYDGVHKVKVTAWSSNETEEEIVKVRVDSEHKIEMRIDNNDFDARICSATQGQTYEITLINTGDYAETIELELRNNYNSIQAVLSTQEIEIEAGEEKKVFVSVNPSYGTPHGDYKITLIADAGFDEIREDLRFRVVEAELNAEEDVIELTKYPREVQIAPGKEKTLSFTIKNPLHVPMEDVRIRFFGTGNEVTIFPMELGELKGGESITVTRKIHVQENASNKSYNSTIELRAEGYVTTEKMRIRITDEPVEEDEEEPENGFLTGFFALSGGEFLLGGLIILILLIAIVIVLSLLHSNKSEELVYYNNGEEGA